MSTRKLRSKPPANVDAFITGANQEELQASEETKEGTQQQGVKADFIENIPAPPAKVQKNIRLRKDLADKLTREAVDMSIKHGVKVHEGAIVDFLLEQRYSTED